MTAPDVMKELRNIIEKQYEDGVEFNRKQRQQHTLLGVVYGVPTPVLQQLHALNNKKQQQQRSIDLAKGLGTQMNTLEA
jgi:hypothetical protein